MKFFNFRKKKISAGLCWRPKYFLWIFIFLLVVFLLNACNLPASPESIRVWIDVPLDGLQVGVGQVVQIEGHASSHVEIEMIDFLVNGIYEHQIKKPETQGNLAYYRFQWTPPETGEYALQIIAYGQNGRSSQLDTVVVRAASQQLQEMTELPLVILTPQLPSSTPQAVMDTPLPSPTSTAFVQVEPENTTAATLTVSPQRLDTLQPTSTSSDFDGEGPPAPEIKSPLSGLDFPCISSLTLQWQIVTDPSGITEYRVEVDYSLDENQWFSAEGSPYIGLSTTVLSLQVECGRTYRWRVQAVDGYRNSGEFSNWSAFAVSQE